jgi:putative ABC transport system substrate-binding protein
MKMIIPNQIKFRRQIILFAALLVAACISLNSCSEKKTKVYKVGILCGLDYIGAIPDIFKSEMTELGYIEGENIVYDVQRTNFEPVKEHQILKQFVEDNVDLIFTFPTEVSMAAKAATKGTEIPVLFAIANIEGTGLVDGVRQPGGHITGVRYPGPDLAIKRFEVMRELAPKAKRMWVPYQRGYPIVAPQMEALHPVAKATGITLIEFPADNAAELQVELDKKAKLDDIGFDAILFIPEPLSCTDDAFEVIAKFAYERNLPIGGITMQVGDYASIFGIDVDDPKTVKQAAILADKILRGTPAGTIPVVSSESYFEINYKATKELGINVSEGLLARADKVIH